jgi:signal transduction histidine kinase
MIENHGGHIAVDNHEEKGAVFTITIPIKKPKKTAMAA